MSTFERIQAAIPQPAPEVLDAARNRLLTLIEAETTGAPAPRQRRGFAYATATAVLILIAAVGILLTRQPTADANLERLAEAIEQIPAEQLPPGNYYYTKSEQTVLRQFDGEAIPDAGVEWFGLLIPETVEEWLGEDGSQLRRVTTGQPAILDPDLEAAIAQSALFDTIGVGETQEFAFPADPLRLNPNQLSIDPDELAGWFESELSQANPGAPVPSDRILDLAVELLLDPRTDPQHRAAVLRVLATTDNLATSTPEAGIVQITSDYQVADGPQSLVVSIDSVGFVVRSVRTDPDGDPVINLPAGTAIHDAAYERPAIVDRLP